ncbi:DNA-directed RNA polymerase subunit K [archaeon]|nr:MAG: DNA-directed RNA polymerase subunit K [archaeon]
MLVWQDDRLTRFEVARLLGARTLQVALGAPVLAKTDFTDSANIARVEFREKLIPITVKRKLPNGQEQVVKIKQAVDNWLIEHKGEI